MKKVILLGSVFAIGQLAHSQNLSVQSGGELKIESSATISLQGDFVNTGTILNAGKIRFQGTTQNFDANNQAVSGNIEIGAGTTTLTGKLRIPGGQDYGQIEIVGTGVLNTGNKLTLICDTLGYSGRISAISSNAATPLISNPTSSPSAADSMILKTYYDRKAFRFFGNPFKDNLSLLQFCDNDLDIDITGSGGTSNGFSKTTASNSPSVFYYSEANNKWTAYTNATSQTIPVGFGASIYVMNRKGQALLNDGAATPEMASVSLGGGFRSGDITTTLSNSANGWNLIANPYPSNINIDHNSITWNNANAAIYMYDRKNKNFESYTRGSGSSGNLGNIIPMGAAFLVQAGGNSGSSASVVFAESCKTGATNKKNTNSYNPFLAEIDSLKNQFRIGIRNENSTGNFEEDKCLFLFANHLDATDNFDGKYDAWDLKGDVVNLGVIAKNGSKLSISSYPQVPSKYTNIPLSVWAKDTGKFSINYYSVANLDSNTEMFLRDKYLNKVHSIQNTPYFFNVTNNNATMGDNRFELFPVLAKSSTNHLAEEQNIQIIPNPAQSGKATALSIPEFVKGKITVDIYDMSGKLLKSTGIDVSQNENIVNLGNLELPSNMYLVSILTNTHTFTQKMIISE